MNPTPQPETIKTVTRFTVALTASFMISVLFIALMQMLTSQHQPIAAQDYDYNVIDFVRLKRDSEVETRQRKLPEKPKPPEMLKPEKLEITESKNIDPKSLAFDIPALDLPRNFTGGPQLGALTNHNHNSGDASNSIIPLIRIQPQYPLRAQRSGIEGEVTMAFTITPAGTVENVKVIHATPRGVFEREAMRALLKWKFKPKSVNGKAVAQQAEQTLVFKLSH